MRTAGQKLYRWAVCAALVVAGAATAQQAASNRVMGTVTAVSGNAVTVKTDAGATVNVTVADSARVLKTAPGQKTLTGATKIAVSDMGAGDRVLMVVAGDPPTASIVVVNKASDVAAMHQQEQADWARRGVGGLVKAVDASAGTVTITQGTRTITIQTSASTSFRRYAPDSAKIEDAQPSTLAAIQAGDQLQALGDKNPDGSQVTAGEVVSGTLRNIAGTVVSVDASASTFTVKDLATRKTVTIKTTADSDLRKLDPQMAQMVAARLRAAGAGAPGAAPAGGQAQGPGQGQGQGSAPGGGGQWRQAGGAGGSGGGAGASMARLLARSPQIQVGDLHKGDAVMIVATSGTPDAATAIRLVAGVEPMLQASASGSQSMFSSAWSLGGSSGEQGGDNP
jgi:hypothetical protein